MASGSSGIPIPPLRVTDRIEDWEPLFRAAVGHIVAQGEAGVKTAVSMLPAFVCRRLVEIEVSKEAVTLDVMVEGNPGVALLDTGAKPSVIDTITLREFGLAHREQKNGSQVFGLGKAAVAVSGQVEVEIDIGSDQRVLQCLQRRRADIHLGKRVLS